MKTIKFKGVEVETGKTVYGDYCRNLSLPYPMIRSAELLRYVEVYPESVKQLVGFDKNGNEVYEGEQIPRPIKFKGRMVASEIDNEYIAEDEELVGGYVEIDGKPHIVHKMTMGWVISEVKPDSVKQLVGFDENGAEVYAGE